jgi:hypothetical protein
MTVELIDLSFQPECVFTGTAAISSASRKPELWEGVRSKARRGSMRRVRILQHPRNCPNQGTWRADRADTTSPLHSPL